MAWSTYKFGSRVDLENFLNGKIVSRHNAHAGMDVDGLTLIIDTIGTPRTATFTPVKSRLWTLDEVVTLVNAAHAELAGIASIESISGSGKSWRRIVFGVGAVFTIVKTGTANVLFGLSSTADTVAAPVVKADVQSIHSIAGERDIWVAIIS